MLASVILFAANVLVIRGLSLHLPAADGWVATLFRGIVGMLVVVIFFSRKDFRFSHLFIRPLVVLRGIIGGAGILVFYITVVHLGAARSVVINLSYPMFGSLIAAIWLKEHLSPRSWIWMVAGFGGLIVFLGGGTANPIGPYDLLALGGAIASGAVIVLIRQLHHTEHTSTIYASQCFYSIIFSAGAAAPAATLPVAGLTILVVAAAFVAVAQLAMTHAYRELAVARGSAIQMLLPIFTAIGGFLFFDETFTTIELTGAALTLLATWQVVRTPRQPHRNTHPSQRRSPAEIQ